MSKLKASSFRHQANLDFLNYLKFDYCAKKDFNCELGTFKYQEVQAAMKLVEKSDPKLMRYVICWRGCTLSFLEMSHIRGSDVNTIKSRFTKAVSFVFNWLVHRDEIIIDTNWFEVDDLCQSACTFY